ncbi:MAG: hypothetical protein E6371_06875 [Terrisporobacter othiniensis]|uniref:hypothetical protein n=1 Tax=Terrisporobacter othiniensis TaxID=1577792 RepID=UPI0009394E0A|nr:hypothetical protein [Terrisporobacter othiniensis]MDU6984123.1 hypothetical protein [Terrisporobacter othiniensis]
MESIYKFIEYINESNILSMGLLIFAILYLIYLYNKKEEIENYLGLKLIGFYLLGAFTFNFKFESFTAIIPIGIIIYLAFMKNKERVNCVIKKKASIMGLIILCVGVLNSIIYNNVEYRDRNIPIKNISIKSLRSDYEVIKKELSIDDLASVESLDLEYNENNKIRRLSYTIKDQNNKTYFISTNGKSYSINTSKTYESEDETFMFSSMGYYNMDIETLLDVMSNTKFKKYENTSYYTAIYKNEENYYENDKNLYIVDLANYSTKKLNSKYPIYDAVDISHMPMEQVSEGSWTSTKTDTYLMRYNIDEELDE